jgi:LysM repeat protein
MKGFSMVSRRSSAMTALVGVDGLVLVTLRPRPGRLGLHLAHPQEWAAEVGADRALAELAGAALWLAAGWLGLGLVAAIAGRLPGTAGRCAGLLGRALLPRAVRSLVAGSAGLGVLLTPVVAGAAAQPSTPTNPAPGISIPAPGWPVSPPGPSSVPPPVWPSTPAPAASPTDSAPPRPSPVAPAPAAGRPQPTSPEAGDRIRVRAGDCLWLIASRRLGPQAGAEQVAAEWPRWFAANKDVIGADPAVIRPGQVLRAPAPATSPEEASR